MFSNPIRADAVGVNLADAPKVKIISGNASTGDLNIGSDHVFIPELSSSSKLIVPNSSQMWGDGFVRRRYRALSGSGNANFYTESVYVGGTWANWENAKKNMNNNLIRGRYTNVGHVNGNSVDLIMTVKGLTPYGKINQRVAIGGSGIYAGPVTNLSFREDEIGFVSQGFEHVDLEFRVVLSGTDNTVDTAGYYTFNDVDFYQIVGFSSSTWNNINDIVIEGRNNSLKYRRKGGYHEIGYPGGLDVDDRVYVPRHAFTILYGKAPKLDIRWSFYADVKEREISHFHPRRNYYTVGNPIGHLLMYTTRKPVPTDLGNPTKTQSPSNGYLRHGSTVTYNVTQDVPYEHSQHYYSSFELRDTVDKGYDVTNYRVYNNENGGRDVTGDFNISLNKSSNEVIARAKPGVLKSSRFYGLSYRLEIKAKVDGHDMLQQMGSKNSYKVWNQGISIVNGKTRKSNWVELNTQKRKITVNHVSIDHGLIRTDVTDSMDGLSYKVSPRKDLRNHRNHIYRHIDTKGQVSGTVNGDVTVTFLYDEPREINVEHRTLEKDGYKLLSKDDGSYSVWEYTGNSVTVKANWNTYRDHEGYFYRPVGGEANSSAHTKTFIVKGDTKVVFYYDTPRTISVRHYDKDDDRTLRTTYIKGIYDNQTYTARTLIKTLLDVDGYYYRPVDPSSRVGKVMDDMQIHIAYERPRIIELLHYDNDSKELITTDIYPQRIYDTDGYDIYSYADEELKYRHNANDTTYFYYPLDPYNGGARSRQTGQVDVEKVDIPRNTFTLRFYYTKPALDLGINYIRIDTDTIANGAPVALEFDHQVIVPERWKDNDVTLTVYDRDANIKLYEVTDLDVVPLLDGKKLLLDNQHIGKGGSAIYEAVLTTNDKQKLVTGFATQSGLDTNAHTASERVVKGESIQDSNMTFKYEGVAMTDRVLGQDVVEHMEYMTATIQPTVNMISGYGYNLTHELTFATEVDDHEIPSIKATSYAHPNISEGDYELKDGLHVIEPIHKNRDSELSRETVFDMPKVYVNRKDGDISLTNDDNRVEGHRKAYSPIWIDRLGAYTYNLKTNRFGRNQVSFDLDNEVNIDAYMFGHIDSETLDDDALLITPANKSTLGKWFK